MEKLGDEGDEKTALAWKYYFVNTTTSCRVTVGLIWLHLAQAVSGYMGDIRNGVEYENHICSGSDYKILCCNK